MKKEIRVFVINPTDKNYPKDFNAECSNEEFMDISEKQGTAYSLKCFENTLNSLGFSLGFGGFSKSFFRFIEVEVPEFTPQQEKQIELLEGFKAFLDGIDGTQVRINNGVWLIRVKEFVKKLGES